MDIPELHALMITFVVKKDMVVFAIVQKDIQERLRAGLGGTR